MRLKAALIIKKERWRRRRVTYEEAHREFIKNHTDRRKGERKGRLIRGHNYAEQRFLEQVWWPALGSFDHLHPDYKISDWNRKSIYLDFAYITPLCRIGIECDGYQSHVRDMDREKFRYSLNRDTFLTGMGWRMVHFSFDDIDQRPELCRMLLKLVLAPYLIQQTADTSRKKKLHYVEKEIIMLAWRLGTTIRPKDVSNFLSCGYRTSRKWLGIICEKGMLIPLACDTASRVSRYELSTKAIERMRE